MNNIKHGRGWYYHKNEGLTYTGWFEQGVRTGCGRLDGKSYLYSGGWSNGIMQGMGYMKQDERTYFGFWNNGKRDGLGYELNLDYCYKGFWKDDKPIGYGIMKVFNKSNLGCKVADGFSYYPTIGKKRFEKNKDLDNSSWLLGNRKSFGKRNSNTGKDRDKSPFGKVNQDHFADPKNEKKWIDGLDKADKIFGKDNNEDGVC